MTRHRSLDLHLPERSGKAHRLNEIFNAFAHEAARLAGKPVTFIAAAALIVGWALSGPLFGFSDTWQLVANTTTTIITFLMVFLIQNTQNRDALAMQIKLAELILVMRRTPNGLAVIEGLTDGELEELHKKFEAYVGRRPGSLRPGPTHARASRRTSTRRRNRAETR
jgi:low affinity Fe/Cu permease